ncbi:MAG TPA: response regulator transcription factor [Armatimonadota bacterium]|nr:response regulator transcription factor [Armatimonadota bacterium]
MEKIRVLIAEDEAMTRELLARLIGLEPDIEVVGQAANGKIAVGLCRKLMPDVLLTDIRMPDMDGIQATKLIKTEMPSVQVVILTIHHDDANVFEAIKAGARGYVLKESPPEQTVAAIRAVVRGEALLHPGIASRVIGEFNRLSEQHEADLRLYTQLTDREREVLKLLALGKRNREIAEELFIAEKTVKNHVSNILWKLECNDRTQAALFASRVKL